MALIKRLLPLKIKNGFFQLFWIQQAKIRVLD